MLTYLVSIIFLLYLKNEVYYTYMYFEIIILTENVAVNKIPKI